MATLGRDGSAKHASAFAHHEIDLLLGDFLGGDDKVAFILSVLIVNDDDKLAAFELFNSLVNGIQFEFFHYVVLCFCS